MDGPTWDRRGRGAPIGVFPPRSGKVTVRWLKRSGVKPRFWVFSSAGRAPRLHRGCHRFDPGRTHQGRPVVAGPRAGTAGFFVSGIECDRKLRARWLGRQDGKGTPRVPPATRNQSLHYCRSPSGSIQLWKPSAISARSRTRTRSPTRPGIPMWRMPPLRFRGRARRRWREAAFWGFPDRVRLRRPGGGAIADRGVSAARSGRRRGPHPVTGHRGGQPRHGHRLDHRLARTRPAAAKLAPWALLHLLPGPWRRPGPRTTAPGPPTPPADGASGGPAAVAASAADDGYRYTTDFLRVRLRIGAAEARRRLALAEDLLPRSARLDEAT
ncbi:MAG: hypothetical protein JWM13_1320 [Arthrobacter sp.]|nr:hypothetical protein [Arthrobacter sp.]